MSQTARSLRQFTYRGYLLKDLVAMDKAEMLKLLPCRARRKFKKRGLSKKVVRFMEKLKAAKAGLKVGEKPKLIKTHLRNVVILPEMVGSLIGVYNGQTFVTIDIKDMMIGTYLAEYAPSYKSVYHGRAGVGATKSSKFVPLR
ncbi:putative multi-domain containing protein [Aduncisulcus paluster]|uniref:Multi-domain containing protein n=1 Tax=Aduncisulcus paluster TaxID=2918883 RepID=A0ABQ5K5X3_9EUKA|nr:putative multi-domain containing protein [Aduncisulcus paluster]|eukprot:gnl/Carplike_NY0171/271_a382_6719.p1 GENE.gnl/Carplike_NY0171/271_a382_6719~~gnl/Carplike_NY0171/271_a382_6719.p1  ORF type:complete len:143 (+),score=53.59 gnl/Carplike_NY0171/271_a382_6719:6-434(+)